MEVHFSTKFVIILIVVSAVILYLSSMGKERFGIVSANTLAYGAGYLPQDGNWYEGSSSYIGPRISMSSMVPGTVSPHGLHSTMLNARFNQYGELTEISPSMAGLVDAASCHKIKCPSSFDSTMTCWGCNQ